MSVVFRDRRRRTDVTLNVISLVDVLFLLLIFFMLTGTFKRAGELDLKLPESESASPAGPQAAPPEVEIVLTEQETLLLNGRPIAMEALPEALRALHAQDPAARVMIDAETGVPHGQVVRLLDAVRGAGFRGVGIGASLKPPATARP
jgi:biopolymer transport protein ExbD